MKEKDNIRHGDVDDMIFGSDEHVSERYYTKRLRFCGAFSRLFYSAFSIVPPPRTSSPS